MNPRPPTRTCDHCDTVLLIAPFNPINETEFALKKAIHDQDTHPELFEEEVPR